MKRLGLIITALGLFLFAQRVQADWTSAKRLTWTSGSSEYPGVATDSSLGIHVVWEDDTPGNWEIYYKRTTDGGTSWSLARRLSWTSGDSHAPAIAIDSSDYIHVVWYDDQTGNNEIYYKQSTDGGATWSASRRITWTTGWSEVPAIATGESDSVHILWDDYRQPGNFDIYYKHSTDGGATWSSARKLAMPIIEAGFTAIAIGSSQTIHVVWYDYTPGNGEIYYARSADGGATWSLPKRLTWTPGRSAFPSIAVDSSNRVHIVWNDDTTGIPEIYYKQSPDGGATWSGTKRLTWNSGNSLFPVVSTDSSGFVHVVWEDDYISGFPGIYYKQSTDGGASWSGAKRLTSTPAFSYEPAMAIDSGNIVHLVWEGSLPDNNEIYYLKGK
jgi:Neuraminidase (sialidase)